MSDQHDLRSARDIDADADRFVDEESADIDIDSVVDLPPEGSVSDIVDQHLETPERDDY